MAKGKKEGVTWSTPVTGMFTDFVCGLAIGALLVLWVF